MTASDATSNAADVDPKPGARREGSEPVRQNAVMGMDVIDRRVYTDYRENLKSTTHNFGRTGTN